MEKKSLEKGCKIYAVLGDSISTYEGYSPSGGVFYDCFIQKESGVEKPEDTWWMQVILKRGGILGRNNSYAGSFVSGNLSASATCDARILDLAAGGEPNVILVNMGANDWGFCVLPEEFEHSYQRLLYKLKKRYPKAEIWCATLLEGILMETHRDSFFNIDSCISKRIYSDIIREAARKAQVQLADLSKYGSTYETMDGVHPNKKGMRTIADLWMKAMEDWDGKCTV